MIGPLRDLDDYEHDSAIYLKAWLILVKEKDDDYGENKLNKRGLVQEGTIIYFKFFESYLVTVTVV